MCTTRHFAIALVSAMILKDVKGVYGTYDFEHEKLYSLGLNAEKLKKMIS